MHRRHNATPTRGPDTDPPIQLPEATTVPPRDVRVPPAARNGAAQLPHPSIDNLPHTEIPAAAADLNETTPVVAAPAPTPDIADEPVSDTADTVGTTQPIEPDTARIAELLAYVEVGRESTRFAAQPERAPR